MERSGAAERYQRIVARIAAALGRDELDGAHDVGVGQLQRRSGGLLDAETEACRQRLEGAARGLPVEGHAAAPKPAGAGGAEADVGLGERGPAPPLSRRRPPRTAPAA